MKCMVEMVEGAPCGLEEGHKGAHQYAVELPPDVNRLLSGIVDREEEQIAKRDAILKEMKRDLRRNQMLTWLLFLALGINLVSVVGSLTGWWS